MSQISKELNEIFDTIIQLSNSITEESKKEMPNLELIRDYSSKIGTYIFQIQKILPSA